MVQNTYSFMFLRLSLSYSEMPLDRKVEEKEQEISRWTTTVIIVAAVVGGVCVAVALLVIGLRVYRFGLSQVLKEKQYRSSP